MAQAARRAVAARVGRDRRPIQSERRTVAANGCSCPRPIRRRVVRSERHGDGTGTATGARERFPLAVTRPNGASVTAGGYGACGARLPIRSERRTVAANGCACHLSPIRRPIRTEPRPDPSARLPIRSPNLSAAQEPRPDPVGAFQSPFQSPLKALARAAQGKRGAVAPVACPRSCRPVGGVTVARSVGTVAPIPSPRSERNPRPDPLPCPCRPVGA